MRDPVALTTVDNPFNPFTQYEQWDAFDRSRGYNSASYLARIANTSNGLTAELNEMEIEDAIDEIVRLNIFGVYKKVSPSDYD